MAIGGVLRAALRAGNWARAAAESRRQARALTNLSRSGFGQMALDADDAARYSRASGIPFEVSRSNTSSAYNRIPPVFGRNVRNPIEAPYEGMRPMASPASTFGNIMETDTRPGAWTGRGRGTEWGELPINGYDGSDGTYFEAYPGPRGFPFFPQLNDQWSWQRFANSQGLSGMSMPRVSGYGQTIPFDEIMRGSGSLLGDPRFGPYDVF